MISGILGKLVRKGSNYLILDVSGLSYQVFIPTTVMQRIDEAIGADGKIALKTFHYLQVDSNKSIPVLVGFLNDIEKDFNKSVKKAKDEYLVLKAVLLGGLSIKNFIYYTHSNEGCFNWNTSSYNKEVTNEEFLGFIDWLELEKPELPKGIVFKLKNK